MLQPLYHKPAAAEYYALWNPLTHACATVPGPAGGGGRSFGVIGGYAHPETRRFHLLHSSCEAVPGRDDLMAPVTFRILRVGGDATWRELPFPPLHDKDNTSIFMRSDRARDRHVSVHGNLHWLVQSGATGTVALLVFDTARDKFRVMAAPERRPGLRLETARIVLWSGKLCVLALASKASSAAGTMEMWVLDVDDYGSDSDPAGASWRLRRRIRMVRLDGADLSPAFMAATTVEVVEGVEEGEEIFLRLGDRIDAYNLREDAWRKVSVAKHASLLMHRVSVLRPEMSFGEAARVLVPRTGLLGSLYHCCFREGHEGY
ncbi:unnamed protein product [Urochloa decumbens]|uniref:F-box associated beta-propeller type 3 domain-containing protein n=1 Tax=Urochloa decumbens TaxID=240449 RepID=A0ABC8YN78_9POAL